MSILGLHLSTVKYAHISLVLLLLLFCTIMLSSQLAVSLYCVIYIGGSV